VVPRISRAQSLDVLSSQANLAGYRAVIEAVPAGGGNQISTAPTLDARTPGGRALASTASVIGAGKRTLG